MSTRIETLTQVVILQSLLICMQAVWYGMSHSLVQSESVVSYRHYVRILTMFSYATLKVSPQLGPPSLIYFFTKNNPWLFTYQRTDTSPHHTALWSHGASSRTHPMDASWLEVVQTTWSGEHGRVEGMIGRSMLEDIRNHYIISKTVWKMYTLLVTRSPIHAGLTEWSMRTPRWMPGIDDSRFRPSCGPSEMGGVYYH